MAIMSYHSLGQTAATTPVVTAPAPVPDVAPGQPLAEQILTTKRGFVAVPAADMRDYVQSQVITIGVGFAVGVTVGAVLGDVFKKSRPATVTQNRRQRMKRNHTISVGTVLTLRRVRVHVGKGEERVVTRTVSRVVSEPEPGIVAARFAEVPGRVFHIDIDGGRVTSMRPTPLAYEIETEVLSNHMMSNSTNDVTSKLSRELAKAEAMLATPPSAMLGYRYAGGGYALEAQRMEQKKFAVAWRATVLKKAIGHALTERSVTTKHAKFRVFQVDGVDAFAVAPAKGSSFVFRFVDIPRGQTAEEVVRLW